MQQVHITESGDLKALRKTTVIDRSEHELENARKEIVVHNGPSEEREVWSHGSSKVVDLTLHALLETLHQRVVLEVIQQPADGAPDCGQLPMPTAPLLLSTQRFDYEPRLSAGKFVDRSTVRPQEEQDERVDRGIVRSFDTRRAHATHRRLKASLEHWSGAAVELLGGPMRVTFGLLVGVLDFNGTVCSW
jgi:hypothetical protein